MTTPRDIKRLASRAANSLNIFEARLALAVQNTVLNTHHGYPTTASGSGGEGGRSTAELTATEAAAHANLGDIQGWTTGERTNPTGDDTTRNGYRPGPITRLDDVADPLRAVNAAMDLAHDALTTCGIPPMATQHLKCRGINAQGCTDWQATNRTDNLCIDCGRATDSNRRRLRRHQDTNPSV